MLFIDSTQNVVDCQQCPLIEKQRWGKQDREGWSNFAGEVWEFSCWAGGTFCGRLVLVYDFQGCAPVNRASSAKSLLELLCELAYQMLGNNGTQRLTKSEKGKRTARSVKRDGSKLFQVCASLRALKALLAFGVWDGLGWARCFGGGKRRMAVSYLSRVAWFGLSLLAQGCCRGWSTRMRMHGGSERGWGRVGDEDCRRRRREDTRQEEIRLVLSVQRRAVRRVVECGREVPLT